jgi:hypothetical protein
MGPLSRRSRLLLKRQAEGAPCPDCGLKFLRLSVHRRQAKTCGGAGFLDRLRQTQEAQQQRVARLVQQQQLGGRRVAAAIAASLEPGASELRPRRLDFAEAVEPGPTHVEGEASVDRQMLLRLEALEAQWRRLEGARGDAPPDPECVASESSDDLEEEEDEEEDDDGEDGFESEEEPGCSLLAAASLASLCRPPPPLAPPPPSPPLPDGLGLQQPEALLLRACRHLPGHLRDELLQAVTAPTWAGSACRFKSLDTLSSFIHRLDVPDPEAKAALYCLRSGH